VSKSAKKKHDKVQKLTEEQYAEYVMAMKEELPMDGYKECVSSNHSTPHIQKDGGQCRK
jgi:hypothetical protein